MLGFTRFYYLLEKNAEKYTDHRISPRSKLLKYINDPDVFVTFTSPVRTRGSDRRTNDSWEKVGVNVYNKYETPTAIYTYPLNKSERYIKEFDFPYAAKGGTSAWVLRIKHPDNVIRGSTYGTDNLHKDMDTLQEIYPNININEVLDSVEPKYKRTPIQCFWSITRHLAYLFTGTTPHDNTKKSILTNPPMAAWAYILNHFYDGVVDDMGQGFIHGAEPFQGCFFSKAYLEVVEHIDEPNGFDKDNWEKSMFLHKDKDFIVKTDDEDNTIYYSRKDNVRIKKFRMNSMGNSHASVVMSGKRWGAIRFKNLGHSTRISLVPREGMENLYHLNKLIDNNVLMRGKGKLPDMRVLEFEVTEQDQTITKVTLLLDGDRKNDTEYTNRLKEEIEGSYITKILKRVLDDYNEEFEYMQYI